MSLAVLCSSTPQSGAGGGWRGGGLEEEKVCWAPSLAVSGAGPGFWVLLSLSFSLSLSVPPLHLLLPAYLAGSLVGFNNSV